MPEIPLKTVVTICPLIGIWAFSTFGYIQWAFLFDLWSGIVLLSVLEFTIPG
jgi:hypothetical protein